MGTRALRFDALVWTHGGGVPGALGLAASAIVAGQAEIVVVCRAIAERSNQRLRIAVAQNDTAAQYLVNGVDAPAQICAMRSQRMIKHEGVPQSAMRAMAMASYYHANRKPSAAGRSTELDESAYEESRFVAEPYLFDCSRENDGAAAVIVVSAARARDLPGTPACVLAAPIGAAQGWGAVEESRMLYNSAGFAAVARRLWAESGYGPADVVQVYENFTGPGVAALIDHGFCRHETAGDVLTFENLIAPSVALVPEAVRQLCGDSPNHVPHARLSIMTGRPGDTVVSSALFGTADTL